jgi:hypothetical protein
MRRLTKKEYVLAGVFAFIAAFPLATASNGAFTVDLLPPLASVVGRRDVMELRSERHEFQRQRAKVMEICDKRANTDADVECPDMNDPAAISRFMRGLESLEPDTGTGVTEAVISIFDLSDHQRGTLRRFERLRTCPETLNDILPGFYELCLSAVEKTEDKRPMLKGNRMIPLELFPDLDKTLEEIIEIKKIGGRPE